MRYHLDRQFLWASTHGLRGDNMAAYDIIIALVWELDGFVVFFCRITKLEN